MDVQVSFSLKSLQSLTMAKMPNMDGLEATRLIRETGYKKPIVALSAYSDDTNVKGCHDAGMDDFVSKPIQLARLRLVLKTFCPDPDAPASSSETAKIRNSGSRSTSTRLRKESSAPKDISTAPPGSSGGSAVGIAAPPTPTTIEVEEEDEKGRFDDDAVSPKS
jgi:osomolarity two-component system, sensor histidine kinase SLN1